MHGQTSWGLNVATKSQSSGYDECREYGKEIIRGRLLEGAAHFKLELAAVNFVMESAALLKAVSFLSPKEAISRSRDMFRPSAAFLSRNSRIISLPSCDTSSFSEILPKSQQKHVSELDKQGPKLTCPSTFLSLPA